MIHSARRPGVHAEAAPRPFAAHAATLLLGKGDGSFNVARAKFARGARFVGSLLFGAGTDPFTLAIGEFNGDGKPDLAIANLSSANASVLLNTSP